MTEKDSFVAKRRLVRTSQSYNLGTLSQSHSKDYHYLSVKEKGSKSSKDQVKGLGWGRNFEPLNPTPT